MTPTIVIFGANGFLGRYLCRHFALQGKEVAAIARSRKGWSGDGMLLEWDGKTDGPWALALEGAEAVINLAGASVNCRYTEANRGNILRSRIDSTLAIGRAVAACRIPPKVWINAGTATWYRHAEDKPQDDWLGEHGTGFSCDVARQWEETFFGCAVPAATRKLALRIGMVLANEEGTVYQVLTRLARRGLGGRMGNGRQRISWIHMDDLLRAVDLAIADPFLDGAVNVTAPEFPQNRDWMAIFRRETGMPIGLPAARWMLEMGAWLLDTETELVLKSRWVEPLRLRDAGFRWRWKTAAGAIHDLRTRHGLDGFFASSGRRSIGARGWLPSATRGA